MALRNIITKENESLFKHSRPVTDFNDRIGQLMDDLKDTLATQEGVGLAAPQVGILRRAVVVLETNVEEGQDEYMIELINPEIIECYGEQEGLEGCLSVPDEFGIVKRPMHVKVRAQDRNGNYFEVEGDGLTARCFCHEIDHLDGRIFTSLAERMLTKEELDEMRENKNRAADNEKNTDEK